MAELRIVLVQPSHPGNIGAAARAMKNMGLDRLVLVRPLDYPHADATARASGADDVLQRATVCERLADAIADCSLVLGASARRRSLGWPTLTAREAAAQLASRAAGARAAVVFGNEQSGLSNEELDSCHYLLHIPADPEYSSINLAMAVQIVTYEIHLAGMGPAPDEPGEADLATAGELEQFYDHLQRVMVATDFLDPENPRHLMRRMRRLFNRARLDKNELNILRGILSAVEKQRRDPEDDRE